MINVWYENMPKWQKVFVYFIAVVLVPFYGIGLFPLALLIYLELGLRG